jgi:NTE family protein
MGAPTKALSSRHTKPIDFLLLGGGLAAATAAQTLRQEGAQGRIVIVSEEPIAPYHRPPLSKTSSRPKQTLEPNFVLDETNIATLDIELILDTAITSIETAKKSVQLSSGHHLFYDKALIATGASPTKLTIPGNELAGVHYLRTFKDALAISSDAQRTPQKITRSKSTAKIRAVVIGGGFIGTEIVSLLRSLDVEVTLIEAKQLLYKLHAENISSFAEKILAQNNVRCVVGDPPVAIQGNGQVKSVLTKSGETIPCDMVVIGAGVTPRTEFLRGTGIGCRDGVMVDEFLQTSDPSIYAAGDVACVYHPFFKSQFRVEHWDNAIKQGRLAARNMMGRHEPFTAVSYFYSHIFDQSFNLVGFPSPANERIDRGSLESGQFEAIYLDHDVPCAFFTMGRSSANTRTAEDLIRNHVALTRTKPALRDPKFALAQIPAPVVYVLQGGGAFGAFECGAIDALHKRGIRPDVVAGVSIGAFNGAIVAGNPDHADEALTAFWHDLSTTSTFSGDEATRRLWSSQQIAMFGVPGFFEPRWTQMWQNFGQMPSQWPSLYDFSAAKKLLSQYVDFDNLKHSPVRLLVTAVDVQSSEVVLFDSYLDNFTVDHVLASGSLPPAFPWVTIGDRHYWDAGIISNSPLQPTLSRIGHTGKDIYLIDLFPGHRDNLPESLTEVSARRDEIVFSDRLKHDDYRQDIITNYQQLVASLMAELPPESARRLSREPLYIQLVDQAKPNKSIRITRHTDPEHPAPKAYDFSAQTISQLIADGQKTVDDVLGPAPK